MKIVRNQCNCHFETCNHFEWYIVLEDGTRMCGSDDKDFLESTLKAIVKEARR